MSRFQLPRLGAWAVLFLVFQQCKADPFPNPRKLSPQWLVADVVPLMAASCGSGGQRIILKQNKTKQKYRLRAAVTTLLAVLKVQFVVFSETRVHPIRVEMWGLLHVIYYIQPAWETE